MQFLKSKIRAQDVLLETRKQATVVCLLSFCGKLILSFSFCLCVYSLAALPSYESLTENLWLLAGVYALFSLGTVFSAFFYAMTDFAQKRWFYKNATSKRPVRLFFAHVSPALAFRVFYLFLLRRIFIFFTLLGYLAPFLLGSGILYYHMRGVGVSPILFYAAIALLLLFLLGGAYYGFAAVQRYAFCTCLLCEDRTRGVIDTLSTGRKIAKDTALSIARAKLRFLLWFGLCVLLLPAFYVVPYYRQTVGCIEKTALDKNYLTPETQKPVIFLHLVKKPA